MKFIIATIIMLILVQCISNEASVKQAEWYKSFENKPLTEREKNYIIQLQTNGYTEINIQPPTIGVDAYGSSRYCISICTQLSFNNEKFDSIKKINLEIAKALYKDVIEDSILFDISAIAVNVIVRNNINNSEKEIYNSFYKKQLERDLKFKVVKKGKDSYKRVQLNNEK